MLTFDDGPWPGNTPAVLKALADECTKGGVLLGRQARDLSSGDPAPGSGAGHTVGTHTWSHANLNGKKMTEQQAKDEIEKGFSAVKWALGTDPSPFFRFPQLQHNPALVTYLGTRNVAMFSDRSQLLRFPQGRHAGQDRQHRDDQARQARQGHHPDARLPEAHRRGAADAARRLKAGGYKIVQIKAKTTLTTLPEYDEAVLKELKVPAASATNARPVSSVVQTVSQR